MVLNVFSTVPTCGSAPLRSGEEISRFSVSNKNYIAVQFLSGICEIYYFSRSKANFRFVHSVELSAPVSGFCWVDGSTSSSVLICVTLVGEAVACEILRETSQTRKIFIKKNVFSREFSHVITSPHNSTLAYIVSSCELVPIEKSSPNQEWAQSENFPCVRFTQNNSEFVLHASVHPTGAVAAVACVSSRSIEIVPLRGTGNTDMYNFILSNRESLGGPHSIASISVKPSYGVPTSVSWSRYGDMLAFACAHAKYVFVWNAATGDIEKVQVDFFVRSLHFMEDQLLAVLATSGEVTVLNVDDTENVASVNLEEMDSLDKVVVPKTSSKCRSIGYNAGTLFVAAASVDGIQFWK